MIDKDLFRNGMSLLGGAVNVITTDGEAGRFGFTATAVTSVTDEPPTLLVCMNRHSFANPHFKKNGVLCVNVLRSHHQDISWDFANRDLTSEQRFAKHDWLTLETGAPILEQALVGFDCVIDEVHEVGTHTVFYCQVKAARVSEEGSGLVYFNRNYHSLNGESSLQKAS
ncbi:MULTISPECIES: flavin reductase [Vibrio]|uniref:Flavin reductase n=2 Tax=Vibrio TaxID=662 RepID=A0A7X4LPB6_9VIBR|nr:MULTISPECIES: flavin reductase [Vibrio]MBF8999038.1 flavin reductase [Vibrio nitrifigilis]MZI95597.1 flavin reductase [Vibrio eleionomae]